MAVAKSNAYGHGLVPYAKLLIELGADWLGVDSIVEAQTLRATGVTAPILVLGYTRPDNFAAAALAGISLTISTFESLTILRHFSSDQPLKLHLKVDTGMHRQGFLLAEFPKFLHLLKKFQPAVVVEGIYSHLAAASDPRLKSSVRSQIKEFEKFLTLAEADGFPQSSLLKHLAATGGTLSYPEARYDLVRIGLGLLGLYPDQLKSKIKLQPALVWKTIISEIKTLSADDRVGYDLTEKVRRGTQLAVCPIGYWHGYPRLLSSVGRVRIKNQFAKIIGRVSMDMIIVDVTKIKNLARRRNGLNIGDEVILLEGKSGPTAEEIARLAQTNSYEIITRLNPLIQRFYV